MRTHHWHTGFNAQLIARFDALSTVNNTHIVISASGTAGRTALLLHLKTDALGRVPSNGGFNVSYHASTFHQLCDACEAAGTGACDYASYVAGGDHSSGDAEPVCVCRGGWAGMGCTLQVCVAKTALVASRGEGASLLQAEFSMIATQSPALANYLPQMECEWHIHVLADSDRDSTAEGVQLFIQEYVPPLILACPCAPRTSPPSDFESAIPTIRTSDPYLRPMHLSFDACLNADMI